MRRVVIGVDDTDNSEEGATWSLVHNVATAMQSEDVAYLSHTIVQLYPVPMKTQNCTATVVEFAVGLDATERLLKEFSKLVMEHSLSDETGIAAWVGFDCQHLMGYSEKVRTKRIEIDEAFALAEEGVRILEDGRGIVGATAALPYFAKPLDGPVPAFR